MQGQALAKAGRYRILCVHHNRISEAPTVVHALNAIDLEFLAANFHPSGDMASQVEMATPSRTQSRSRMLFGPGFGGLGAVQGIVNIERIHQADPVHMNLGVVVAHIVDAIVTGRFRRLHAEAHWGADIGKTGRRWQMRFGMEIHQVGTGL